MYIQNNNYNALHPVTIYNWFFGENKGIISTVIILEVIVECSILNCCPCLLIKQFADDFLQEVPSTVCQCVLSMLIVAGAGCHKTLRGTLLILKYHESQLYF